MLNIDTIEHLDAESIHSVIELDQRSRAHIEIFHTLDSTNSYLLTRAKSGAPSGSICFAEQQTAGRGRLGRTWFSPPGANIYCSLLWRFSNTEHISGLGIAVAVMVADVLKKYGILAGIQLKWPNDILFSRRKLAGILLERNDPNSVVIGIGLNLYLPQDADPNWIGIQEITGRVALRNYLAGLLINELLTRLSIYEMRGLSGFIDAWRQYDILLNSLITVHTAMKTFTGVMCGISDQGELLLQENTGEVRKFCYGEVSVRSELNPMLSVCD